MVAAAVVALASIAAMRDPRQRADDDLARVRRPMRSSTSRTAPGLLPPALGPRWFLSRARSSIASSPRYAIGRHFAADLGHMRNTAQAVTHLRLSAFICGAIALGLCLPAPGMRASDKPAPDHPRRARRRRSDEGGHHRPGPTIHGSQGSRRSPKGARCSAKRRTRTSTRSHVRVMPRSAPGDSRRATGSS